MVVQRVGAFLQDVMQVYDDRVIVVIGHRATMYALEYWCGNASLAQIVSTPLEWRDIPIWHYELERDHLAHRSVGL